jgi:cellobiose phosphorylase
MYRLIVESLLGLRLEGTKLFIAPCLPDDWTTYRLNYRYRDTMYRIVVTQSSADGVAGRLTVDGVVQIDGAIPLLDDQREHAVEMLVSSRSGIETIGGS